MIVRMTKLRILGRRADLPETLRELQDLGTLHIVEPQIESDAIVPAELDPRRKRELVYLRGVLDDVGQCIRRLKPRATGTRLTTDAASRGDVARWAREVRRLRRRLEALERRRSDLQGERELILKYHDLFSAFQSLFSVSAPQPPDFMTYCLVLESAEEHVIDRLRASLGELLGDAFEMRVKTLETGEAAILLSFASVGDARVEDVFKRAGVQEVPVPPSYGGLSLVEAIPRMMRRLDGIPNELNEIERELVRLSETDADELVHVRAALNDRQKLLEALPAAFVTEHGFVIEGWLPVGEMEVLAVRLASRLEDRVVVEAIEGGWSDVSTPVTLKNPRLFKPFEVLVKFFPLPRYGTIDPTPYLAVFFPMFFGLVLGDVGYGALLALLAWVVHRRAEPGSMMSSLAKVAGACAAFAILFGFLYGEFFGDLGHHVFGMPSLWFRREEALLPFLGLALALGFVHIVMGLVLGVLVALRGERREALGRGVAAGMVVLILLAILAATDVLPEAFFTPIIVAILVAFPVLVIAEGLLAPLELLAAVSSIFSYARIMAIGTASVMMAIVANRMIGAVGSVVVGVLFALVFHLVNFVLGVFSPTIHALRLHYVEFFGKFYRPGGADYAPLRHWQPNVPNGSPNQPQEVQ